MNLKTYLQNIINQYIELTNDNGELINNVEIKMIIKKGKIMCFLIDEKYKIVSKRQKLDNK